MPISQARAHPPPLNPQPPPQDRALHATLEGLERGVDGVLRAVQLLVRHCPAPKVRRCPKFVRTNLRRAMRSPVGTFACRLQLSAGYTGR
jgi:hypothetical protein